MFVNKFSSQKVTHTMFFMENLLGKRFLGAVLDFCARKIEEFCGEFLGMVEVFRPPAHQIGFLMFAEAIGIAYISG